MFWWVRVPHSSSTAYQQNPFSSIFCLVFKRPSGDFLFIHRGLYRSWFEQEPCSVAYRWEHDSGPCLNARSRWVPRSRWKSLLLLFFTSSTPSDLSIRAQPQTSFLLPPISKPRLINAKNPFNHKVIRHPNSTQRPWTQHSFRPWTQHSFPTFNPVLPLG